MRLQHPLLTASRRALEWLARHAIAACIFLTLVTPLLFSVAALWVKVALLGIEAPAGFPSDITDLEAEIAPLTLRAALGYGASLAWEFACDAASA